MPLDKNRRKHLDGLAKRVETLKSIDTMSLSKEEKNYLHSATKADAARIYKERNDKLLKGK